ncbi:MAG: ABC transporter substrate-binding protein [Spirochaetota bacterium]|nr:ABC transporter substrate-binding protein [Spirochaetota bacterium]
MKTFNNLLLLLSFVFFLFIFSSALSSKKIQPVTGNIAKIGAIMDQTGPASSLGIPYTKAVRNYFHYINDNGGINGRKIKFVVEDDGYSIPRAFAAFKKLIFKDEVLTILACGGTGQNTALFPQIKKNRIPVNTVSWSWTMTSPVRRYIFTPGNDNKDEIKIIIDYIIHTLQPKDLRIAIVSPDVEYGKSGVKVAQKRAKQYKVKLVQREILAPGAIDATSQILSLRKKKATHIINLSVGGPFLAFLRDAKRYGYFPIIFGSFHIVGDEVAKIAGNAAKNVYGAGAMGSWHDNTDGAKEIRKITFKYNPDIEPPNRYYIKGWITAKITHEGIKRAGKNLSNESFVDALETIKNLDMKALTGPISYSSKDHKGNNYARMYKADIAKGYFMPVTSWLTARK